MAQTAAITLSIINAPHEWSWAYYMMFAGHMMIRATAAGRAFGLDGVLRAGWIHTDGKLFDLLRRSS